MTTINNIITIQEVYANADDFKIVGVKLPYHKTLLNIHVQVDAKDNTASAFGKDDNCGGIVKISVSDSFSEVSSKDCFAQTDFTRELDSSVIMKKLCETLLSRLLFELKLPFAAQNLKNITILHSPL